MPPHCRHSMFPELPPALGIPLLSREGITQAAVMALGEESAIAKAVKGLFGLVRGELAAVKGELVAVREEVAQQNERVLMLEERNQVLENEVDVLRRALGVVAERSELAAMKGGLAVAKGELGEHKQSKTLQLQEAERRRVAEMREMRGQVEEREREVSVVKMKLSEYTDVIAEQLHVAERRREKDLRELREEFRKGEDEMRADLSREREERREVQELNWPRVMEDLAACKAWVNVELEIIQSKGPQKIAWEVSAAVTVINA
ncbi:unnamed protein product [Closterium sp. Naga37s-1]|nr:unnamed protein product [Closterium sp. Naga37s-1]